MKGIDNYEHVVQYYETDQMGIVHHSNYIRWFEEARIYYFDKIGLGYKQMEEQGIISPVVAVSAKYKVSAKFYDTAEIDIKFTRYTGVRLFVSYEVKNKDTGDIFCTGESEHCFVSPEGGILSVKRAFPEVSAILEGYVEKE